MNSSGKIKVSLLCSKYRISHMKEVSIPHLEMCDTIFLANLIKNIWFSKNFINLLVDRFKAIKLTTVHHIVFRQISSVAGMNCQLEIQTFFFSLLKSCLSCHQSLSKLSANLKMFLLVVKGLRFFQLLFIIISNSLIKLFALKNLTVYWRLLS